MLGPPVSNDLALTAEVFGAIRFNRSILLADLNRFREPRGLPRCLLHCCREGDIGKVSSFSICGDSSDSDGDIQIHSGFGDVAKLSVEGKIVEADNSRLLELWSNRVELFADAAVSN